MHAKFISLCGLVGLWYGLVWLGLGIHIAFDAHLRCHFVRFLSHSNGYIVEPQPFRLNHILFYFASSENILLFLVSLAKTAPATQDSVRQAD